MPVLSQAPHADPDSPQQTIRTLCIKTRLWNEDSEFRERQTERETETGRESSPGICFVLRREKTIINTIESDKGQIKEQKNKKNALEQHKACGFRA